MGLNFAKRMAWGLSRKQAAGARLTLLKGEVLRLKPLPAGICVIAGCAWVTWNGRDILLNHGEGTQFTHGGDDPMVSVVGGTCVTIEMLP
jgi:hypothetical protein